MSGGVFCRCDEAKKPVAERAWVVLHRYCNFSAFNGYRRTPSRYSSIECQRCGMVWRTKALYVADLPDRK